MIKQLIIESQYVNRFCEHAALQQMKEDITACFWHKMIMVPSKSKVKYSFRQLSTWHALAMFVQQCLSVKIHLTSDCMHTVLELFQSLFQNLKSSWKFTKAQTKRSPFCYSSEHFWSCCEVTVSVVFGFNWINSNLVYRAHIYL